MLQLHPALPAWHHTSTWDAEIRPLLPTDYQTRARQLRAWTRTRVIPSIDALLQALLCYVFCARSLRQLGAWATLAGLGSISDRAWSRRIRQSTAWALWLAGEVLQRNATLVPSPPCGVRIRLLDASSIRMRSYRGRSARLHCSYDLWERRLDHVVITDDLHAEGITHFPLQPAEIIIADRGYCRRATIAAVHAASAHLVLRWHSTMVPLQTSDGTPFDVATWVQTIVGEEGEQEVVAAQRPLRLLARRLSPAAAKREAYRRRRKATKDGNVLQARTLVFASWLLLITTLPTAHWPRAEVFALYRTRWQIETLFKRLKQLVQLHGLPSHLYRTNEAILALMVLGWALLDHQETRGPLHVSPTSPWQSRALVLHTWRAMLWGSWSWEALVHSLDTLYRYLRPSRPLAQRWSDGAIRAQLVSWLHIA
jgi:hypothetical protein